MDRAACDSMEVVLSQSVQLSFQIHWLASTRETHCLGQVSMQDLNTKEASLPRLDSNEFLRSLVLT